MMKGMLKWDIECNTGQAYSSQLPGSYYVPGATSQILSSQHWAQNARDNKPLPRGTWYASYDDEIVLC
jgi:hypothetical protein